MHESITALYVGIIASRFGELEFLRFSEASLIDTLSFSERILADTVS